MGGERGASEVLGASLGIEAQRVAGTCGQALQALLPVQHTHITLDKPVKPRCNVEKDAGLASDWQ
jgi:hypothetical protein